MKQIILLYVTILAWPLVSIYGQQSTIELSSPLTGNQLFEAAQWIKMSPGFSYTASSGNTFIARIITGGGTVDPDPDNPLVDPNPPDLNTYSAVVGYTNGNFDVSPTGAATYQVPIVVPAGIAGLEPNLSVVYNSQAGEGLLGIGWSLSGGSAITRTGKNKFYDDNPTNSYIDDNVTGVDFSVNDRFLLDGNRLVSSGTAAYGAYNSTYRLGDDNFTKIVAQGNATSGIQWFEATTKEGYIIEYGRTADSRIEAQGTSNKILLWNINKIYDKNGNYIEYFYYENNATGEYHLQKISYTGNSAKPLSPPYTVNFFYKERTDKNMAYVGGYKVPQNHVLSHIKVNAGQQLLRQYFFTYNTTGQTRLSKIIETGNNLKYEETVVNWNTASSNTYSSTQFDSSLEYDYTFGDYNGDGKMDFVRIPIKDTYTTDDKWELFINTGNNNFNLRYSGTMAEGYTFGDHGASMIKRLGLASYDLNGNGKDVIALVEWVNIYQANDPESWAYYNSMKYVPCQEANGQKIYCYVRYNLYDYNGTTCTHSWGSAAPGQQEPKFLFGDFYGSGKTSCEIFKGVQNYIGKPSDPADPYHEYDLYPIDINGDGRTEFFAVNDNKCIVFKRIGYSNDVELFTSTAINRNHKLFFGDFNGDGNVDILSWYYGWKIYYSTGTGLSAPESIQLGKNVNPDVLEDNYSYFVRDFNGDGRADIMEIFTEGSGSKMNIYYRQGTDFTKVSETITLPNMKTKNIHMVDFNGDGQCELLYKNGANTRFIAFKPFNKENMVSSITNGFKHKVTITYKSLTEGGQFYSRGTAEYPAPFLQIPLCAVSSVKMENNVDNPVTVDYKYEGAQFHKLGKGFLGFEKITSKNNSNNITTITETSLNTTLYARLPYRTTVKLNTTTLSQSIFSYAGYTLTHQGEGKTYFFYIKKKEDTDEFSNTVTSEWVYNTSSGMITQEKVTHGSNMYKTVNYLQYATAGATVKPQIVEMLQRYPDDPDGEYANRTYYTYDTGKGYVTQQIDNYHTTDRRIVTDYSQFDAFGNPGTKVTSGVQHALTERMEYDPTGRFVKKYTSPLGLVSEYLYDDWGNTLQVKDNNTQLLTKYKYDDMGHLYETEYPDGRKQRESIGWTDNSQTQYLVHTQVDGRPWVKTWSDLAGRETAMQTIGPKNMNIARSNTYNEKGELTDVQNTQGDITTDVTYTYDGRGRADTETYSNGKSITYGYGNRTLTTTVAFDLETRVYSKKYDAWANLIESKDPAQKTVTYKYKSIGKPMTITAPGNAIFKMAYDNAGNQTRLEDPNAGVVTYEYDAWSRIVKQTDARGNQQETFYDVYGRIDRTTLGGKTTQYDYVTAVNGKGKVKKISESGTDYYLEYGYDQYGRTTTETRYMGTAAPSLVTGYHYDTNGNLDVITYPGNVTVGKQYDTYGNLNKVSAGTQDIWELGTATGSMVTASLAGGGMTTTTQLNTQGMLTRLKTETSTTVIRNLQYTFDAPTGNLASRKGMVPLKESFEYDALDRLDKVKHGDQGTEVMAIDYDTEGTGNIISKTGLGTYSYGDNAGPHALTGIQNTGSLVSAKGQKINYNAFNKASYLKDTVVISNIPTAYELDITYGPDQQRWKSVLKEDEDEIKSIIFAGNYEKITEDGVTRELYYISGGDGLAAIYVKQAGQADKTYYVHADHLGSIIKLTNGGGSPVFEATYDAWGKQDITTETFEFHRGYTGHEHLPKFGLINMNGRMYDPVVGRFLSPDPYVPDMTYSQDFNRYMYARNNPLIYTDPDGEFVHLIVGAVIGGTVNLIANWNNIDGNFWKGLGYFGVGAAAGALGAGVGAGVSSMLPVSGSVSGGFAAGFWGTTAATTATSSFISGAVIGGAAGFSSGFVGGLGNGLIGGQNFGQALGSGLKSGAISGLSGAAISGITSGINAVRDDRRFWDGATVNDYRLRDHNIPYVPQNADYNCGPASTEAVTNGQLNQNDVRTALGGDPNKKGIDDLDIMQHIQSKTGRNIISSKGDVAAMYNAMTNQGNVVLSLSGNPGHMVVANSVWERTVTKISGRVIQRLFLEVMNPASGQYIRQSIGNNQRFFTIFF